MPVNINPQINELPQPKLNTEEAKKPQAVSMPASTVPEKISDTKQTKDSVEISEKNTVAPKSFISKTAYLWVNFTEGVKGIATGVVYGLLSGLAFAGLNAVASGMKKIKNKEMGFFETMFHPRKAMSTTGKVLSFVIGGAVLAGNLIWAKLKANKRTADVDHALYDGHRGN